MINTAAAISRLKTLGIDLAKNTFSLHGVDAFGNVVLRKTLRRAQLNEFIATLPPCTIGIEACSSAHHFARLWNTFGHVTKLMAPVFVKPYRQSQKNDANDAAAICEAVSRPTMRFVSIKSIEQQAQLAAHRLRQGWVRERTALINRLRGLLSEFGVLISAPADTFASALVKWIADCTFIPGSILQQFHDAYEHLTHLDDRIESQERFIKQQAKINAQAQTIQQITGVGPITAHAIVSTIPNAKDFKNGRQFAAFIGLVPAQYSTGGKTRLGKITKKGDNYLRHLLIQGARSALQNAKNKTDHISLWICSIEQRLGFFKTLVAIANKHARLIWAMLAKGEEFKPLYANRAAAV